MSSRLSISEYYRDALEEIRSVILRESEAQIIGSDVEELAKFYIQDYSLSPIELDPDRGPSLVHENYVKKILAHQRESFYSNEGDLDFPCKRIKVEIPIKLNTGILTLSRLVSSSHSLSYSENQFHWTEGLISFVIETKGYGVSLDEDVTAVEVKKGIERVDEIIRWKNTDLNRENPNLLFRVKNLIEVRKNDLLEDKTKIQALAQKINIPLKKQQPQGAKKIDIDHKPIVKKIKPSPHLPPDYCLDETKVNDILEVLDNQAKSFEKTPRAFISLKEEDLRDIILSNLNSIFQGKATGETFSKNGKTDIYLNIDEGNILVFECKNWGGKKLFLETIDQLRGYMTWRQNYGVIIFFVKAKNFTKILSEILADSQESSSYVNGAKKVNETHFVAKYYIDDPDKNVEIHCLFYNLYVESQTPPQI